MEIELADLLGRKIDLNTPQSLSCYSCDRVIAEAKVQYDIEKDLFRLRHVSDLPDLIIKLGAIIPSTTPL